MKIFVTLLIGIASLSLVALSGAEVSKRETRGAKRHWGPPDARPSYRDEPLREENISDIEVRQIQAVMKGLYPGSIVYISSVITGCPCEDGPQCTDQVWCVAFSDEEINQLGLSRIGGKWKIGPLQDWWMTYEEIQKFGRQFRSSRESKSGLTYEQYQNLLSQHYAAAPRCAGSEDDGGR